MRLSCLKQGWTKKAEQIKCPAPLPESPADPLLTRMLVPVPYQALEKKTKKKCKEAKDGPRRKGPSDTMSGKSEALSSHEGDEDEKEEEQEENNSPPKGRRKKRAASADPKAEVSKRGRVSLTDDSDSDAEVIPKHPPRSKPPAES